MSDNLPENLSENEILEIEAQVETTRRAVLKGSAAGLAAVGVMALSGCGPSDDAAEEKEEASGSMSETVGGSTADESHNITPEEIKGAERVMGISYTDAERAQIVNVIDDQIDAQITARGLNLPNALHTAQVFDPRLPGKIFPAQDSTVRTYGTPDSLPASEEDIAFAPVTHLSHWIQTKQISSRELTDLYLKRIAAHGPKLECFVTVTDDLARGQASKADAEIAAGRYRSPLHGIPYGLKDLMDTANIRTSWGATPYMDRVAEADGTVTRKLREAGAVLVGKTTLGALAYGDVWFDGKTRNPWNTEEGSSGSSAGSASATAAGLVGFGIGTETLGSIVSPSSRCGTTGLRPTFGRVSRAGAMALCWSLDKIGPICRSVEDTALVLSAINGYDTADASSIGHGFAYDGSKSPKDMRVGYVPEWFENGSDIDRTCLAAAKSAGLNLKEISLPKLPYGVLVQQLTAEAAAAFEELTLSDRDDQLIWQDDDAWPNSLRAVRFLSAVDLVNIDRFRRQVMGVMDDVFSGVDAMIGPNYAGSMLVITNYTGQPQLALRGGFFDSPTRERFGDTSEAEGTTFRVPQAFSVWGPLFGEENALLVGKALEAELGVAAERPNLA